MTNSEANRIMRAEARLNHTQEICRMQAQELETKDNQMAQIMAMFTEHEQRLEDTYNMTREYDIKRAAYFKLQELRDLRKEIETIQEQEG